jgi:alpha-amylase
MPSICFYFEVHQPYRIPEYTFVNIGNKHNYEDKKKNFNVINAASDNYYLPINKRILNLINKYNGEFRVAYSLSGTLIEQLEQHRPDVLQSFIDLANTNCVEFLAETYYHSLSYLYSKEEFHRQVQKHQEKIERHFNQTPKVFRNNEFSYNNEIAIYAENLGYKGIICDTVYRTLFEINPNQVFSTPNSQNIKCLLKHYNLSDDAVFRFSQGGKKEFPLTVDKFSHKNNLVRETDNVINIFMNYQQSIEKFGFLDYLPEVVLNNPNFDFKTPIEIINSYEATEEYDTEELTSQKENKGKTNTWESNSMQHESLEKIHELEGLIKLIKDPKLLDKWSKLLTSDHFYRMRSEENDVDDSPYEAYIYFMNIASDLEKTVTIKIQENYKKEVLLTTKVA